MSQPIYRPHKRNQKKYEKIKKEEKSRSLNKKKAASFEGLSKRIPKPKTYLPYYSSDSVLYDRRMSSLKKFNIPLDVAREKRKKITYKKKNRVPRYRNHTKGVASGLKRIQKTFKPRNIFYGKNNSNTRQKSRKFYTNLTPVKPQPKRTSNRSRGLSFGDFMKKIIFI